MKTFKDLEFKKHPNALGFYGTFKTQARLDFENGYGVSVITGGYGNDSAPYELAVMKDGVICSDTYITDDVLGWLTDLEVTEIMRKVQKLK